MTETILITGTDGFIGSYLKKFFLENGYKVFGTVFLRQPNDNEIKIDFCKKQEFEKLPKRDFKFIIHTIGIVDQTVAKKLIKDVNATGTKLICNWALNRNCNHFIFISSVSAYGYRLLGENRTERETKRNWGIFGIPYMKSKAKAERYVEQSGLNYTILRLPPVIGKGDTFLSPAIIPKLLNGTFFFCSKKDRKYSTLYIKNLGPILKKIIESPPSCDIFNCTDFQITWKRLVEEYVKHLGINLTEQYKPLLSVFRNYNDKDYLLMIFFSRFGCQYPNDKLKIKYNFNPIFSWKDGVKEAVDNYLQNLK
ncbi:MAG: NAD-dependent epimerase/dehydratase family protein [Candidatus Hodarchaeota archaeon]